ncbi:aldehyde reductase [Plasmodium gonderi]|uniref:Aldehyde reductase n=1 Tax=Plasmodium gonderi TaxID=77519 RepID=A0A1Y1JLD1_PLAGO|nr:aldehyde reductase [Plasmodium gonderi]GAW81612.1 aldehyde reductase [Plasmodium gonderi]
MNYVERKKKKKKKEKLKNKYKKEPMKRKDAIKYISGLIVLFLHGAKINCKERNFFFSPKNTVSYAGWRRKSNSWVVLQKYYNYHTGDGKEEIIQEHLKKKGKKTERRKKNLVRHFITRRGYVPNKFNHMRKKKINQFVLCIDKKKNEHSNDMLSFINERGKVNYDEKDLLTVGDKNENGKKKNSNNTDYKNRILNEDDVSYKYVEEMELKKINIRGVDIEYRIYNLEEGIYIVDNENYEKIKNLWNEEELKKAKENFQGFFGIKNQGIKDDGWIMLPFDYDENKNIKLVKADFDNPMYDYIITYYDKERNYYFEYKRRNYYKMFRNTIHEIPPYKSQLEEDRRYYGKEIIIPKKKLDNEIFRQPMLSDVLTGGCSREPIGLESWRHVKYPYGNLIEYQKYSQLYCIKKNGNKKPSMRYHYLGNSNLAVSEICLGTMNFGNYVNEKLAHELFDYAYEEFQVNFFDTAEIYPLPVSENYFGLSEEILGNWIKAKGKANRHKFVIATKICGRTDKIPWAKKYKRGIKRMDDLASDANDTEHELQRKNKDNVNDLYDSKEKNKSSIEKLEALKKKEELYLKGDKGMVEKMKELEKWKNIQRQENDLITLSKESIISSVDNCLTRLKTNYIDLLQLHWPDRYYPNQSSGDYSDVLYDYNKYYDDFVPFVEQLQAINELKKKGKIREWGLSNETPFGLLKFYELCKQLNISPPVSVQLEYNLLCRNDVEKGFLEICRPQNTNVSILAYSPLCAGILTGKYLEYTDYTTKGRMQKFPSYMKRLRGSIATYIIRELYYLSQKYYFPNLTVAALKWVYTRSFVTSTVIGISDFLQLRENLYSLTEDVLFTDKLEREINALHWKFRDPIRIIQ